MNSSRFTNTLHHDKCYWQTSVSGRYKCHNFIREQQLNTVSEILETTWTERNVKIFDRMKYHQLSFEMATHNSGFLFPKNFYYHLNMCVL